MIGQQSQPLRDELKRMAKTHQSEVDEETGVFTSFWQVGEEGRDAN